MMLEKVIIAIVRSEKSSFALLFIVNNSCFFIFILLQYYDSLYLLYQWKSP